MILTVTMNPAIDKVYAIDDFHVHGVFRPKAMTATAGGKGLNVARVARILGQQVMATGLIGGAAGQFIHDQLHNIGIIDNFVPIKGETRICINIMDEKNNTSTEILEPGPVVSEDEYKAFLERFEEMVAQCDVVTASGSLPRGIPADFYRSLIAIAKRKRKIFILDTSGEYLKEGIKEGPFMVKPNQHEFRQVVGHDFSTKEDYVSALKLLKRSGVVFPVLSLGDKGCVAALPNGEVYHFFSPPIKVVNTVGSGDAFVAGCAVALSRAAQPIEVIKLGMACGMANTQFFETGMVSPELVAKFLECIQIDFWGVI
ncbi:MAG: 1-phosphofructokinase family hexose kinase [Clostridia bacterium]